MTQKRIHLVFKTHLDIGFTDHAAKVRPQYHERFIPQAIDTGEHFFAEDPDDRVHLDHRRLADLGPSELAPARRGRSGSNAPSSAA